jgi:hypothetical protein
MGGGGEGLALLANCQRGEGKRWRAAAPQPPQPHACFILPASAAAGAGGRPARFLSLSKGSLSRGSEGRYGNADGPQAPRTFPTPW